MSWYHSTTRSCNSCNYQFEQEESTIAMAKGSYGKCPKCGGVTIIVAHPKENAFVSRLKSIYK